MIVNGVETTAFFINKVNTEVDTLDSIDAMVIHSLSERISVMQKMKNSINASLNDPSLTSDPGTLAKVQAIMAEYTLQITMYEKLASSGIKAIDTLVKS